MTTGVLNLSLLNLSFKPSETARQSAISRGSAQGGVPLLREADRAPGLTRRLAETTGARSASSTRCGGWSPSGCSASRWGTRTSTTTTSFGTTVRWRWSATT